MVNLKPKPIKSRTKKRETPTWDDFERLAENLKNNGYDPENPKELNEDLKSYFGDNKPSSKFINKTTKAKLLKTMMFKRGGGKNLKQDQQQTSKIIYPDTPTGKKQYLNKGTNKSDLDGFDTKKSKKLKQKKKLQKARRFNSFGTVKGKIVKVRPIMVNMKGKKIKRYIDSKGRFAKKK